MTMALVGHCNTCGAPMYDWRRHTCLPAWLCWISDGRGYTPEDGKLMYTSSPETAAEEYAEWHDSQGDYTCIGGDDLQITVRCVTTGQETVFKVTGEQVPAYTAYKQDGG